MKRNVLVIDDDEKLNSLLKEYLSQFSFHVSTVTHPEQGLKRVVSDPPDIIILDIMLPEMDGFEVCREIRKISRVPIIMLTARDEVADRIVGLEMGADDYLPKPFEPRELVARIQAILRRGQAPEKNLPTQSGEITIDYDQRSVKLRGKVLDLTTAEFSLLSLFINNPERVLTREFIMEDMRGLDWDVYDRSVDVLVSRLRQKLGETPKNPTYIKTIWGTGYMYIGDKSED
ncbi:response regulator transcription factor [Acidobacteriota bacterium]